MIEEEASRLADLSKAVRESTLKRLFMVKKGQELWSPTANSMNFADLAQHLIDADQWLFRKLKDASLSSIKGKTRIAPVGNYDEYLALLETLHQTGERRKAYLYSLDESRLKEKLFDDRFGGEVSVWWIIVRGNLDHEAHHRGQIAVYLRILGTL